MDIQQLNYIFFSILKFKHELHFCSQFMNHVAGKLKNKVYYGTGEIPGDKRNITVKIFVELVGSYIHQSKFNFFSSPE